MAIITITLFIVACLYGIFRPGWMMALIILLAPMEQLLQGSFPFLSGSSFGNQLINYSVGFSALISISLLIFSRSNIYVGLISFNFVVITLIYIWSIISITWSLDNTGGIATMSSGLPYYFLKIIIGTILITSIKDFSKAIWNILILGIGICILIFLNPAFTTQWGRLGIIDGGKIQSNSLALGDLGAFMIIGAGLLRQHALGFLGNIIRLAALVLGIYMAIQSGARGQLFLSFITVVIFSPISAKLENIKNFLILIISLTFLICLLYLFLSTQLEGFAASRFSIDSILYGSSSAIERVGNFNLLLNAYLSSPSKMLIGLGYYSFNSLGGGTIYSHILVADFIFELGFPGIILLILLLSATFKRGLALFQFTANDPILRCSTSILLAIIFYLFLLSNKQGELWGSMNLFMLISICSRLFIRNQLTDQEDTVELDS